jgi:hypothetical protein
MPESLSTMNVIDVALVSTRIMSVQNNGSSPLCADTGRQECPTLWRMYEYVASEERQIILSSHREKSELTIGAGGEGYIAEDEWCYNCGQCGHWGDVSIKPVVVTVD